MTPDKQDTPPPAPRPRQRIRVKPKPQRLTWRDAPAVLSAVAAVVRLWLDLHHR